VDPDGAVMPCHRFLYRPQDWLGTVDSPYLSSRRNPYLDIHSSQFLACQECEAKPVCGGGCRAVTLESGRGLLETHPGHCLTTRAHARAAYHIYETLEDNPAFVRVLRSPKSLGVAISELALR
jgi:radical SAM protein with 4Fe4S-binding SPASM domain